jgi:hypothetical protein
VTPLAFSLCQRFTGADISRSLPSLIRTASQRHRQYNRESKR